MHSRLLRPSAVLPLAAVLLAPAARPALAQNQNVAEVCNAALMKDVLTHISSDQQRYSYFSQIDERTYEQLKIDANANVGVPIPLLGEMVEILKASASYAQFMEKRREYFQRIGYSSDSDREVRDITVATSPIAYTAWTSCIDAFTKDNHTVAAYKDQEDKATVHVQIRNTTLTPVRLTTSDLMNGSVAGQKAGKAFRDNTVVAPGGTIGVLVRRAGEGVLKLAVQTEPQYALPAITSEWGAAPSSVLTGVLRMTFDKSEIQDRGDKRGDVWDTPNLHNEKCHQQPCLDKWQGATGVLWVTADPGYQLRNPRLRCDIDNQGACYWANDEGRAQCIVAEGGTRASCSVTTSSRNHRDVIVANQYQVVTVTTPPTDQPVLMFSGSQFELVVPTVARSAIFEYHTANGAGALKPGDPVSADGAIALIGHADAGDATHHMYRLLAPQKPSTFAAQK